MGKPWLPCSTELLRLGDYSTGPGIVQAPMSKNVGLMQRQMQKKLHMRLLVERKADPQDTHQKGNGHARVVRLDLDGATPEKRLELFERIFWSRVKEFRRVIAFTGVDAGEMCSKMSARVAEILAPPLFRRVCLVDAYLHSRSLSEGFGLRNPCGPTNALHSGGSSLDFTIPVREGNLSLLPCLRQNRPTPGSWPQ
jgi:Mrp family chromosome partitioning ATPase